MTSSYGEIVERLEKLTAPDRELDCLIAYASDLRAPEAIDVSWRERVDRFGLAEAVGAADRSQNIWSSIVPLYTASIDAAVALVEKMLPGWIWGAGNSSIASYCAQVRRMGVIEPDHRYEFGPTPAIALLIALFRALTVNENG